MITLIPWYTYPVATRLASRITDETIKKLVLSTLTHINDTIGDSSEDLLVRMPAAQWGKIIPNYPMHPATIIDTTSSIVKCIVYNKTTNTTINVFFDITSNTINAFSIEKN